MLKKDDNDLLTRVGPGTPMGSLLREYWLPALAVDDLDPGGRPMRIRLLGEDLVAFRDARDGVGVLTARCPHRGAPLAYARNEGDGLRCVYHGWKYDAQGRILDLPTEAPHSPLRTNVRATSYVCRVRNRIGWVYLGRAQDDPPDLPDVEWNQVAPEQVHISFRVQECNWFQALEGELDSSHAPILHGRVDGGGARKNSIWYKDLRPRIEMLETEGGMMVAAQRDAGPDHYYWRINQFVYPFYTMVPPALPFPDISGHAWVPIDDHTTLCVMFSYHPTEPLPERKKQLFAEGHRGRETGHLSGPGTSRHPYPYAVPYGRYRTRFTPDTDYEYDLSLERTYFSGLPGLWVQDAACQSGIEPILDRELEHLGAADAGLIRARRLMLRAARRFGSTGELPPNARDAGRFHVRSVALRLPREVSWVDEATKHAFARGPLDYEVN
jgi:phenylpropionate dioxygenase-like ring-hydroxylating dioxygenase large terminal subunit